MNFDYDIVLTYTSFRRHEAYVNIVKGLAGKFRVGILRFKPVHKWESVEDRYLELCSSFGADIFFYDDNKKVTADILILPRFGKGYKEYILSDLPRMVSYKKLMVMTASLMGGYPNIDEVYEKLGKPSVLVQSEKYFGIYEPETRRFAEEKGVEIVEVGVPFCKYPIFPDFSADYILAYPSHCSVFSQKDAYILLRNFVKAFKEIGKKSSVYVKRHNAREHGNKLSYALFFRRGRWWKSISAFLHFFSPFVDILAKLNIAPDFLLNIFSRLQNDYIFYRCKNLTDEYPAFGIEHFMCGLKEGVITGMSNVILLALVLKKKVYAVLSSDSELKGTYRLMAETFGIREWDKFSSCGFSKIPESVRESDIVKFLESFLKRVKKV